MQSITIVLVGDEGLLLLEFEEALTAGGFDVVCFSSGAKAITYLASKGCRAEGVVTDIRLSDPSTNTATEMAVVYISGDSAAEWAINGVPNSMMLEKPFAMAEMITAVDQLLNDRSTGPASA
ncbi:response regulator [Sinorhizobium meliloti]|uniref:response regulator n=1 Tax=Rhizobium meliloti TaxID=382 RepID=UPI000FD9CD12|nr:response regulator [Sinorhizobium meliloti]RVG11089.1 response regulator [Sinorhizobium meliloti]